jgi:hypothetical protein
MAHEPEDRPEDPAGRDHPDPFDTPARDDDRPPSEGDRAGRGEEASGDAIWLSSPGYPLTQAYEAARPHRPDLTDDEFRVLATEAFPSLSGHWGSAVDEILAHVNAVRPPGPSAEPRTASRRRLRLERALAQLAKAGRSAPTEDEIAKACRPAVIERTVRRWLHEEPELRDLLPWLSFLRSK